MQTMIDQIITRLIYEANPHEKLIAERYTLADLLRDLRDVSEEHECEIEEWKDEAAERYNDGGRGQNSTAVCGGTCGRKANES